jgi:cytochrome c553
MWAGAVSAAAVGAFLVGCNAAAPPAPVAAEPPPPPTPSVVGNISYNELMVRWIDNASHVLWDTEKPGFSPKNDADWLEVEDHAVQLAAAGTLIQLPGTGVSDAIWAKAEGWQTNAKAMAEAGKAAQTAAQARNLAALVDANGQLVATCEGCHKAFKPELPTEGVAHQRPHSDSHGGN